MKKLLFAIGLCLILTACGDDPGTVPVPVPTTPPTGCQWTFDGYIQGVAQYTGICNYANNVQCIVLVSGYQRSLSCYKI